MKPLIEKARSVWNDWQLPAAARAERARDARGLPAEDPGSEMLIRQGAAWLARAQDCSRSRDGGVARHFSLIDGWSTSYPETTGYIVPTMLELGRLGMPEHGARARRMLDWLARIQLADGGFQGGRIDATRVVPVTFNTGQILLGLAAGAAELGEYRESMRRAADWLVATQDADGCWRKFATPFAAAGEKVYETHVSWGLFAAARVTPERGYGEAGVRQVRWALGWQRENGWFDCCCLTDPERPLTHTLGYALRGIVECYLWSADREFLVAARRTADGLLSALEADGRLPGRLTSTWQPAVNWVCLTGSVQIAHSWLLLYRACGEERYLRAAQAANRYVRRTIATQGSPDVVGGVKGSFPVDGGYGRYEYLNWAAKFAIDSHLAEQETVAARAAAGARHEQAVSSVRT